MTKFEDWLQEVDTPEQAEEWFGFTNEDMFNYWVENVRPISEYHNGYIATEVESNRSDAYYIGHLHASIGAVELTEEEVLKI